MEKLEDDLFFADLTRQISLLIMDDDEDPVATCPSVSLQVHTYTHHFHYSISSCIYLSYLSFSFYMVLVGLF